MMVLMVVNIVTWQQMNNPSWFVPTWVAATVLFAIGWLLFIIDVWRNARVPPNKRALWTAILFFGGPYVMPFYFWFYVR